MNDILANGASRWMSRNDSQRLIPHAGQRGTKPPSAMHAIRSFEGSEVRLLGCERGVAGVTSWAAQIYGEDVENDGDDADPT